MGTIGQAKALAMPRQELAQAKHVDVAHEFPFEITTEAGGTLGVVTLKAGGKVSRADTHRRVLKLRIKDEATGGRNLKVHRDETRSWER